MFTGIIRHFGTLQKSTKEADGSIILEITAPFSQELTEGDSVAVNGVCLTVLSHTDTTWTCRLMAETIKKTTLGLLPIHSQVNLELPAKVGDTLDGHIVQGHVDAMCSITDIAVHGDDRIFTLQPPQEFLSRITPKGSIALDGVSLTVVDVADDTFTVSMMPYTLKHTTFGAKKIGDTVNMETDHSQHTQWLSGTVIRGDGRGKTLGFPTANIKLDSPSAFPEQGIFACRVMVADDPTMYAGALHAGPRPTFIDALPSVEVHILNFHEQDVYEKKIAITVLQKVADIQKFDTTDELIAAITENVATIRAILVRPA